MRFRSLQEALESDDFCMLLDTQEFTTVYESLSLDDRFQLTALLAEQKVDVLLRATTIMEGMVPKDVIKVIIPNSVTNIRNFAFYDCSNLKSVTIGNNVERIGNSAFYDCSSLESITIPDSVTSIGRHAFSYCDSLESINIPNSVESIGGGVFSHCESLTSITIPNSVERIGTSAFYACRSLTEITFNGTKEEWNSVLKGEFWRQDVPATVVKCIDGEVSLLLP